ncbi:MAG: zinc ribbon domain-containing protein [Geminicoccaceae bacterium]|nr:zinc ribbon domain-containing protein [Geminicoccaceae bacterium]
MPLYEYACPACGIFTAWGRMATAEAPAPCPGCGAPAPRAIASPALGMERGRYRAHARNERAAHEPGLVTRRGSRGEGGHGHHHHPPADPRVRALVGDACARVSRRPWSVGH